MNNLIFDCEDYLFEEALEKWRMKRDDISCGCDREV